MIDAAKRVLGFDAKAAEIGIYARSARCYKHASPLFPAQTSKSMSPFDREALSKLRFGIVLSYFKLNQYRSHAPS